MQRTLPKTVEHVKVEQGREHQDDASSLVMCAIVIAIEEGHNCIRTEERSD
jgi:hypothetical protein